MAVVTIIKRSGVKLRSSLIGKITCNRLKQSALHGNPLVIFCLRLSDITMRSGSFVVITWLSSEERLSDFFLLSEMPLEPLLGRHFCFFDYEKDMRRRNY